MTTATAKQLSQTALTATTTTTLYTVPAATKTILKEITLCNTDTSSRTVTIQAGASPATGASARILSAVNLLAGETKVVSLSMVLEATHLITGGASSASVVSCTISGAEVA